MADEPTLPTLPARRSEPSFPTKRLKRSRVPDYSSTSSDPAFFSSDDDPALDNYQAHARRKKRYVGAWFDQQPASSDSALGDDDTPISYPAPRRNQVPDHPQKREFKRQLDSGVWMDTDACPTDMDDMIDLEPRSPRFRLPQPAMPSPLPAPSRKPNSLWDFNVQEVIRNCVDNGLERVDLTGLEVERVPEDRFELLSNIAPIPNVAKDVAFEQRDPRIQLFLSNNRLSRLPPPLINVEHLTVLSLRANRLVELPPAICKMKNLEALNVAQNKLRMFPGGLLDLLGPRGKLRTFNFAPNPFVMPRRSGASSFGADEYERLTFGPQPPVDAGCSALTTKLQFRSGVEFTDLSRTARTKVCFPSAAFNTTGRTAIGLEPFTELAAPAKLPTGEPFSLPNAGGRGRRGPKSLFEAAMRACVASGKAYFVLQMLEEDHMHYPNYVAPTLRQADDIHRDGGLWCAVCGRDTLVPLTRWFEFRQIGTREAAASPESGEEGKFVAMGGEQGEGMAVPFLRSGCSWDCVPVKVEPEEEEGGEECEEEEDEKEEAGEEVVAEE
ncbi:CCR4-NOT transcription complex subunit 6-like-B [Staphylotrichum tortipilum]|uniref:CCR4-NOT transcription complex subunit 6-like-B n=1 Tax=Staphylotrichum tortipilum TaxID=2831512 RepID=A0AAN6RPY7_9PEZI|nr:CCR4-NOT transcription complex subunit 6-like-B [Staphylotrichum longicolle]